MTGVGGRPGGVLDGDRPYRIVTVGDRLSAAVPVCLDQPASVVVCEVRVRTLGMFFRDRPFHRQ